MSVQVIYPKAYHECHGDQTADGWLFTCPQCGYQRRAEEKKV